MSKLIFIRSYLLIVLLILFVGLGLDRVISYTSTEENIATEKTLLQGSFRYIEMLLKQNQNKILIAWPQSQLAIQKKLGYPVTLYLYNDFSDQEEMLTALMSGKIIEMATEKNQLVFYQQLQNTEYIVALGPLDDRDESIYTELMISAIYHFLVAGALFVWLWPLSNDLHELRQATSQFGKENFATRVKLRKNSSIASVANAFNFMTQRIQDLVIAHKDLTHAVSHELKTPLSRFKFSLEIISSHDDSAERHQYIQAMKQDVRELDDLIDEMLRYAKLNTDNLKLHLEKINTEHWIKDIITQYKQEKIKIYLQLSIKPPETEIMIDVHLMSRAVHNLIRNGLRYAQHQLQISLEINNQQIQLRIDDDGLGIPEQDIEHVFQPFVRLDSSRDKQSGGYGLGLAITQKIVHQHGGVIVAEKSTLGGARFRINWKAIENLSFC